MTVGAFAGEGVPKIDLSFLRGARLVSLCWKGLTRWQSSAYPPARAGRCPLVIQRWALLFEPSLPGHCQPARGIPAAGASTGLPRARQSRSPTRAAPHSTRTPKPCATSSRGCSSAPTRSEVALLTPDTPAILARPPERSGEKDHLCIGPICRMRRAGRYRVGRRTGVMICSSCHDL
jgi:hypothetical protein